MSFHKDQSLGFKKVKVEGPWRVEQETVGTQQPLPWLDPSPVYRCTLFVKGVAVGVVDWDRSGFYDRKFFAFLSGSGRYTVHRVEDEEGYVPPKEIRFGPRKNDDRLDEGEGPDRLEQGEIARKEEVDQEDAASEESLRGPGQAAEGGADEGPSEEPDEGAGDPGAEGS